MASIKNRGPNAWQVRIRRAGYPTVTETFDSERKAQKWAEKSEGEMKNGTFINSGLGRRILLCDLIEEYLDDHCSDKKSYVSDRSYANNIIRKLGQFAVVNLTLKDVKAFRTARLKYVLLEDADEYELKEIIATNKREKRVGPNSVIHELKFLAKAIDYGVQHKSIVLPDKNPARVVKKPKRPQERIRRLSKEERDLLSKHTTAPWLPDLIDFAIESCMRRGELARMRWGDEDLELRTLDIKITKNGESRTIPLSNKAAGILKSLPAHENGLVWGVSADRITQAFSEARGAAGIEDLHFHDLRHEGISRLFERGLNTMEAASISGHRDLRELKRYTHIKPTHLVERLDKTEFKSKPTDNPDCPSPSSSETDHATSSKTQNTYKQDEEKAAQPSQVSAGSWPESGSQNDSKIVKLDEFRQRKQSTG